MTCERYRTDMAAHLYGELEPGESSELEIHVEACAGCREEWQSLKRVANSLDPGALFPREAEVDWEAFAASTVQRAVGFRARKSPAALRSGWREWLRQLLLAPGWSAAAAGLLLVAGAALGTYGALTLMAPEEPAPLEPGAPVDISRMVAHLPQPMLDNMETINARAGTERYLSESRALLMSILASPIHCDKDTVDIKDERSMSLQLIRRQRLLADELEKLPLARAQEVCRDLEQLLLEIIAMSDCARSEQILELRDLVEKRQLLLRMELLADEMARRGPTDA